MQTCVIRIESGGGSRRNGAESEGDTLVEDKIKAGKEKHEREVNEMKNSANVNLREEESMDSKIEDDEILETIEGCKFEIEKLNEKIEQLMLQDENK